MMSLFKAYGNINEIKGEWTPFEPEPVTSKDAPQQEDSEKTFISLEACETGDSEFVPFGQKVAPEDGQKTAEDIICGAEEKAALLEREAYEKGFAQGEKDGIELGRKRALKVTEKIEGLFSELGQLKKNILKEYEKEILDLVFSMVGKIVDLETRSDQNAVQNAVLKALNLAVEKSEINLRVNPGDYEYVENLRPDFFSSFKELKTLEVTPDKTITRGGCYLVTSQGNVDSRVETQLEKIHQCLEQAYGEP